MTKTLTLISLMLLPLGLIAQVNTYSSVVGFDTINVGGSGGSGTKLTFAATEFVPVVKRSGTATSIGSDTLTDTSAAWLDDQYNGANGSHYIEITSVNGSTSAAGVGTTRTISATTAATHTLALSAALPAGLAAPIGYKVMKHWTLSDIFGSTNTTGIQGGTAISADQIQLWDGTSYASYYYQTSGIGGTGWRKVGDQSTDASGAIIRPDQSVIVKRGQSTGMKIVVSGLVKTGPTSVKIVSGFNFVPNPYSKAMTLASCGLYTGSSTTGIASGNLTTADQVLIWIGTGYQTYYYQTSGIGGTGWRKIGDQSTDASTTSIEPGTSIIVRRFASDGFTWTIPQHPSSF